MNKQLTIRQLLDEVQKQFDGHFFNTKWLVEYTINATIRSILYKNGFESIAVRFVKPQYTSRTNNYVLICPNRNAEVLVTLRHKQVREKCAIKWGLKALETFESDNEITIFDMLNEDNRIKEEQDKKKQDDKNALFELMDEVGYERFKKFAKMYANYSWKYDREYEARA